MRLSLRSRILIPVLLLLLVGQSAIVSTIVLLVQSDLQKSAYEQNREVANRYAQDLGSHLGPMIAVARANARTFETLKAQGVTNRAVFDQILQAQLKANPDILSTWTVWEPDALDGRDKAYVNKDGSDDTGRYIPAWYRDGTGAIVVGPCLSYEKPGDGDYYVVPRQSAKEYFVDPYTYSYTGDGKDNLLICSYSVPMYEKGKFVGVVGIDMSLVGLAEFAKGIKVLETGFVTVATNSGARVIHPKAELVGKQVGEDVPAQREELLKAIAGGKEFSLTTTNPSTGEVSLQTYAPLGVGQWDKPWSLAAVAPLGQLLGQGNTIGTIAGILGAITLLAIALMLYFVIYRVTQPVRQVASILATIAVGEGDLTQRLGLKRTDEIGELSRNYDAFVDKLSGMIRVMQATTGTLQVSGNHLANSLTETASSLHEITSNVSSAKGLVVQQDGLAADTSAAVTTISGHVATLQGLVGRQDQAVESSASAVEQMVGNIESVTRNVETLDHSLKRLVDAAEAGRSQFSSFREKVKAVDGQSENLQETNQVISGIASQTNLLAMNAAIEAAHAGEAGRGFAVVADEIRKLAEQASQQSTSTAKELKTIQSTIRALVADADATEGAFGRILEEIGQVEALESEVRSAMSEQQVGSRQILEGINDIREASQELSTHSGAMNDEAIAMLFKMETLHRVTQEIRHGMDEISLGTNDINQALAAISEQGNSNKASVDELAHEASQFKVRS
ncbi:MAG: methyl-accepting chemotaxis protein [Spirochaetales bacterium]